MLCLFSTIVAAVTAAAPAEPAETPARTAAGERERPPTLLARMTHASTCFPRHLTDEQIESALNESGLLLPTAGHADGLRFATADQVWTGEAVIGPGGLAAPASLTYSFPDDGTQWGLPVVNPNVGPSDLDAKLTALFGSNQLDRGRELIRQGLASWHRYVGLDYREVADDGSAMDQSVTRTPARGDIRIGGLEFGTSTFLAYNAFPSDAPPAGVGGGDMAINTSFFIPSDFGDPANTYRFFRNTVSHEHGHGIGLIHSVPCNDTKLLEPFISSLFDTVQLDDIRGAHRNYGDRLAPNQTPEDAHDFGDLTSPSPRSVIEPILSTNGASGPAGTSADWFRFSISSPQDVTITVTPLGGSYTAGQQTGGCNGTTALINAEEAGNLTIVLYSDDGVTAVGSALSAPAGDPEILFMPQLAPGTYTLRVRDVGPNPSANQVVQLYSLEIDVDGAFAPPIAIAGIDKRCRADRPCFFYADLNSGATEPGASLVETAYQWDLDGDGTFETTGTGRQSFTYPSNGVYTVSARVTDTNGSTATDTIDVTVFGATTAITENYPPIARRGQSVPMTIIGTNLRDADTLGMYSITGTGVTLSGTPTPNATGTEITGLMLDVDPSAELTPRTLTIHTTNGSFNAPTPIQIVSSATPPTNDECTGAIDLGGALGTINVSLTDATTSAPPDLTPAGCPSTQIHRDVWFRWTAPNTGTLRIQTNDSMAVYPDSCPPASDSAIACAQVFVGLPDIPVEFGQTLLLRIGNFADTPQTGRTFGIQLVDIVGACCVGASCATDITPQACTGDFDPSNTCDLPASSCCPVDFNRSGTVSVSDILDFLSAWSADDQAADTNRDGVRTVGDILDYLSLWAAGCSP